MVRKISTTSTRDEVGPSHHYKSDGTLGFNEIRTYIEKVMEFVYMWFSLLKDIL